MYKAPPLSFAGNKRNYRKLFLQELPNMFDDTYTFVDMFGGSGYLSYLVKYTFPKARVIYNDYDDYSNRLNHIPETNEILSNIRTMISGFKKNDKLDNETKAEIIDYLRECETKGMFVDCISISANICFSNNFCDTIDKIAKANLYNRIKTNDYDGTGYLDGLEIRNDDYKSLIDEFKDEPNTVFIMDPPYLASEKRVYKDNYWDLSKYFSLFRVMKEQPFWFFFTNGESFVKDLLECMDDLAENEEHKFLYKATIFERTNKISYSAKYVDIMIVKDSNEQK